MRYVKAVAAGSMLATVAGLAVLAVAWAATRAGWACLKGLAESLLSTSVGVGGCVVSFTLPAAAVLVPAGLGFGLGAFLVLRRRPARAAA